MQTIPWKAKLYAYPNLKTIHIIPLPNGKVAHALTYWPNVGAFANSVPKPPNKTPLRNLQYTSTNSNLTMTMINNKPDK